jgi:2-amino-4-hydroxy-6-hydroxymethyldihydropteridine diphosphokinase
VSDAQLTSEVFIALGSNIGNRKNYIHNAIILLGNNPEITVVKQSSLIETKPVGPIEQDLFINAVIEISTSLTPQELLATCLAVEEQIGRVRTQRWGPRTIDLDILLFADRIIAGANLKIPHPELSMRAFVLVPLAEIAPKIQHPVLRMTALDMLISARKTQD